jgi:hypothetical protein
VSARVRHVGIVVIACRQLAGVMLRIGQGFVPLVFRFLVERVVPVQRLELGIQLVSRLILAARRPEGLALSSLDLGRISAAPALELEVLADRVIQ